MLHQLAMEGEDWLVGHPKLSQLTGYVTGHRPQLLSTMQVYLTLTEVKLWQSVDISYSEQLRMAFITAQERKEDTAVCILPLPASSTLSMERFSEFFTALEDHIPSNPGDRPHPPQLTLAIVGSDSTVVYYQITHGIQAVNYQDNVKKVTR